MSRVYPKTSQKVNRGDSVSILRTLPGPNRKVATKIWRTGPDGPIKENYAMAARFDHESRPCQNIRELSAILSDLEVDPHAMIVRGELAPGIDPGNVRRKTRPDNDGKVWFNSQPRPWACIDFDGIPAPACTDASDDPEGVIEYLIGLMPKEFHDTACHWQLSSSAGMSDDLSAHVWFWFDEPVSDDDAKRWGRWINEQRKVKAASKGQIVGNLIDPTVFNTVQPHYTAAPVFEGFADPICRRSGFRDGDDAVTIKMPPAPTKAKTTGFNTKLQSLGDGLGREGFNLPLIRAVASYVASNGIPGPKEADRLKGRLRAAMKAAPKEQGRNITRYESDDYLDDIIRSAVRKYGRGPVVEPQELPPELTDEQFIALAANRAAFTLLMFVQSKNLHHGKPVYIDRRALSVVLGWGKNTIDRARQHLEAEKIIEWISGGETVTLDDGTVTKRPKAYALRSRIAVAVPVMPQTGNLGWADNVQIIDGKTDE